MRYIANDILELEVDAPGVYNIEFANGRRVSAVVKKLAPAEALAGAWQVSFPSRSSAPRNTTFDALTSWTEHPEEAIRYFSGTATYRQDFKLSASRLRRDQRLILDLGDVQVMAKVIVNGKILGLLWKPPFTIDVTDAVKSGLNRLEVQVTNLWSNRLVGATHYPQGFPAGGDRPWSSLPIEMANPLLPSGLLGPVSLQSRKRIEIVS